MTETLEAAFRIDAQAALIYTMMLASQADGQMSDAELDDISRMIHYLPAFDGLQAERLSAIASEARALMADGLDTILEVIAEALSDDLRETAFLLAAEVVQADRQTRPEERRVLGLLADKLSLTHLEAAALNHAAKIRYRSVSSGS